MSNTATELANFGAFARINRGIEGLMISERLRVKGERYALTGDLADYEE